MASALSKFEALEQGFGAASAKVSKVSPKDKTAEVKQATQALGKADETQRRVLEATLESLQKGDEQLLSDVNEMVLNIVGLSKETGVEFTKLDKPTEDEVQEKTTAEDAVKAAEAELTAAHSSNFIFRSRNVRNATAGVATAKAALVEVGQRIAARTHERIMKASMGERFQSLDVGFEKTIGVLTDNFKAVMSRRETSLAVRDEAQGSLTEESQAKTDLEDSIRTLGSDLEGLIEERNAELKDSPKYNDLQGKVNELGQQKQVAEGKYQTVLASYERLSQNIEVLSRQIEAQNRTLDAFRTLITMMEITKQYMVVQCQNRLTEIQSRSNAEIAAKLIEVGDAIAKDNAESAVATIKAMGEIVLRPMESNPAMMRDLARLKTLERQVAANFDARTRALAEDLKKNFGVDPFAPAE